MSRLDIAPTDEASLRRVLAEHAPDAEVWAYGSRVTGGAHAGSDIDLVLRNADDPERSHLRLPALRTALSESDIAVLVDVVDWARIPESFRRRIEQAHVVLQPAPASARR